MKLLTKLLVAACFICAATFTANAQDEEPKSQMFFIHVDHVITAKSTQYEEASKGFNALLKEGNAEGVDTWAFSQSNGDYMYVSFLENMAELDVNPFSAVQEKVGKEAWDEMYSKYDNTYLEHESFIVNGHPKYSYKAEQLSEEDMNYRVWSYNYFEDKNWDKVMEAAEKWRKLYESKNIESGFTVYTGGFGSPGPVIIIMQWAKSPADYYAQAEKNRATLGEEGKNLGEETMKLFYKHEKIDGYFRPDLSYITTSPTSASSE